MHSVVSKANVTGGGSGSLGCFQFNPLDGRFYISLFGSGKGLRVYDPASDTSQTYVDEATLNGFSRASDVPGGWTDSSDGGAPIPSGMVLNPVTIYLTWHNPLTGLDEPLVYPPGTLAYLIDGGGNVVDNVTGYRPDWTKKMWRWDLRPTWVPTLMAPDYGNARNGLGQLVGAYGTADWNDVFTVVFTEQDLHAVSGNTEQENLARQFAWTRDGAFIYFTDRLKSDQQGGIWKLDPTTGALQIVWRAPVTAPPAEPLYNPIAEPAVIHTATHDFTGGVYSGEQILFDGLAGDGTNGGAGNYSGISYIVDDGSGVHGPFVLFTKQQFERYAEWNGYNYPRLADEQGQDPGMNPTVEPRVYSIITDDEGNVFFYDSGGGQTIWRFDPQGRFIGVKSRAQHQLYNLALGSADTGAISMRFQLRTVAYDGAAGSFDVLQLLFMATKTTDVGGVFLFRPGDFDRDNDFDQQDVDAFLAAMQTPIETFSQSSTGMYYEAAAVSPGHEMRVDAPQAYANYLKYDLNNNGLVNGKDKLTLWRLRNLAPVDYDADGDVDEFDQAHIDACMGHNTTYTTQPLKVGDIDGDGVLSVTDLERFGDCATGPGIMYRVHGLPASCGLTVDDQGISPADIDEDGDIDQIDFGRIQAALGNDLGTRFKDMMCGDGDLDNDHDVDQDDLSRFAACVSGDGVPADPHCLD